jgi:hypothetical protein
LRAKAHKLRERIVGASLSMDSISILNPNNPLTHAKKIPPPLFELPSSV